VTSLFRRVIDAKIIRRAPSASQPLCNETAKGVIDPAGSGDEVIATPPVCAARITWPRSERMPQHVQ